MATRTFRYDREQKKVVEITRRKPREEGIRIQPDIEPFRSSVDGTIIGSRKALREHNKRNGVIQASEWGNDDFCDRDAKRERESVLAGTSAGQRSARIETIRRAIEKHGGNY